MPLPFHIAEIHIVVLMRREKRREIAARTKGDMSKLTPEEQKKLQEITKGQGQRALNWFNDPTIKYR